jgi:hypothetical protein
MQVVSREIARTIHMVRLCSLVLLISSGVLSEWMDILQGIHMDWNQINHINGGKNKWPGTTMEEVGMNRSSPFVCVLYF